jgi:site-specific DNA-methyltransferase (adenine-specific)
MTDPTVVIPPDGSLTGAALADAQRTCEAMACAPPPAPVALPKTLPDDIVIHGDCLTALRTMPDNSVDSVVTDPPAGIGFMGKAWDSHAADGRTELQAFQDFIAEVFTEVYRALKPGGHAVVWALPRTSHHTAMGLERAGFDIRDNGTYLFHLFGTGFPKSLDVSKAIDKAAGAEREQGPVDPARAGRLVNQRGTYETEAGWSAGGRKVTVDPPATDAAKQWDGWGTALKPAVEFWILARKPLIGTVAANVQTHGTGALNIDATRIEHASAADLAASQARNPGNDDVVTSMTYGANRPQQRVNAEGRFPANLMLDEGAAALLDSASAEKKGSGKRKVSAGTKAAPATTLIKGMGSEGRTNVGVRDFGDGGGASRFFYTAKAPGSEKYAALTCGCTAQLAVDDVPVLALDDARERKGQSCPTCKQAIDLTAHPTVKSTALMEWLIALVTPLGGLVLDPFTGSGSTGVAALRNGFAFRGIERETAYCAIARQRITDAKPAAKRDPRKRHVRP